MIIWNYFDYVDWNLTFMNVIISVQSKWQVTVFFSRSLRFYVASSLITQVLQMPKKMAWI